MIIECGHCGAPLDVKANDQVSKCAYCGTSNQVKSQRTIAFETPQGWQPPPQWTPPAHLAANSQQVLTYKTVKAAGSAVALVVGLSILGVIVVIGAVVAAVISSATQAATQVSNVEAEVNRATQQANDAIAQALAQATAQMGGIPGGGAAQSSLLNSAGVVQVLGLYKQASGASTLKIRRLTMHDSHSSAALQNPTNPKHLDGYDYINGGVTGPKPERLSGREKDDLEKFLFDPEKTALVQLDTLKQAAIGKLGFEGARITHIIASRDRGKVEILVYVSSDRDSGYVSFDEKGKVTRVAK